MKVARARLLQVQHVSMLDLAHIAENFIRLADKMRVCVASYVASCVCTYMYTVLYAQGWILSRTRAHALK